MSYQKAIMELSSQGKFHIKLGLERVLALLELLGNPHNDLKVIHVAGTNGKGSTCVMLASVLAAQGYKVGLYTSPHLVDYTERIKINGEDILRDDFAGLFSEVLKVAEQNEIHVTEFEILTVMAFVYFKRQNVDFVVLETGLGGRLDATNVVDPILSVITSIDIDHSDRLGSSVEDIAAEKAGIVKKSRPIVISKRNKGFDVVEERAEALNAPVFAFDENEVEIEPEGFENWIIYNQKKYKLGLTGLCQKENASLVFRVVAVLRNSGIEISEQAVENGLLSVKWPARFQFFEDKNLIIDGAHNPAGAQMLRKSLDVYFPHTNFFWIYSSINTKDFKNVVKTLFREGDIVVCTKSSMPSSVKPSVLMEEVISSTGVKIVYCVNSISESFEIRNKYLEMTSVAAGSLYTAGEIISLIKYD